MGTAGERAIRRVLARHHGHPKKATEALARLLIKAQQKTPRETAEFREDIESVCGIVRLNQVSRIAGVIEQKAMRREMKQYGRLL